MNRLSIILLASGVLGLVGGSVVLHPEVRLIYNASESAPRGFYRVDPVARLHVDDWVIARLPDPIRSFAAGRGYLPQDVPLMKRVAALEGSFVCVVDGVVLIDGAVAGQVRAVDGRGRSLPVWSQCRRLLSNEMFLIGVVHPASFDSRYFGPIDVSFLRGQVVPLLTWASN